MVNKYIDKVDIGLDADYLCVFPKSEKEYNKFDSIIKTLGKTVQQNEEGDWVWLDKPIETEYGLIKMLRIHKFAPEKKCIGYADYKAIDYDNFKSKYLGREGFKLMKHPTFEMVELKDDGFDVCVYIPDTPLTQDLKLES